MIFKDREEAGSLLSLKLSSFKTKKSLIMAIPRGGVVVGKAIAERLNLSLETIVVRKIGSPNNQELAIGAVGPESTIYLDWKLIKELKINSAMQNQLSGLISQVKREQQEKEKKLRGNKGDLENQRIKGKEIVLVDDGVATGATVVVAAMLLKKKKAKKIILAVPVIANDTLISIKKYFNEIIFLDNPEEFHAVGQFYQDFPQVSDEEVTRLLNNK